MLRVEWRAHEVRDVGSLCGCATADNVRPARRLLKSLSIKQGRKYDDPESARDIPTFIEFHRLDVDEILDPIVGAILIVPRRNLQRILLSVCRTIPITSATD